MALQPAASPSTFRIRLSLSMHAEALMALQHNRIGHTPILFATFNARGGPDGVATSQNTAIGCGRSCFQCARRA